MVIKKLFYPSLHGGLFDDFLDDDILADTDLPNFD